MRRLLRGAAALALLVSAAGCASHAPPRPARGRAGAGATDAGIGSQVATFEHAWRRIADTYPHADMRGLDWEGVREELLPRARQARNPQQLRPVLEDMLAALGESHFLVIPGDAPVARATTEDASATAPGEGAPSASAMAPVPARGAGDLGLEVRAVGDAFLVTRVREGGPAAAAGIEPGWELEAVDGEDMREILRDVRETVPDAHRASVQAWVEATARLAGRAGSTARLELVHGGGGKASLDLVRSSPPGTAMRLGNLPEMHADLESRMLPGEVGYVRFNVFLIPVAAPFSEAVKDFIARDARGIVVDLRGNPGGIGAMVMGMAGHFLEEEGLALGVMTTREAELRYVASPRAPSQIFRGPLAVLVDEASASTAEMFAAGLQQHGRARLFGTRTAGMALPSVVESLPNGDRLQFAFADLRGPAGERIEGVGVMPDVVAPPDRETLLAGGDPALDAALAWIAERAPAE